jgi:hypothetical protein
MSIKLPEACPGCGDPDYDFRIEETGPYATRLVCRCGQELGGQEGATYEQVARSFGLDPGEDTEQ